MTSFFVYYEKFPILLSTISKLDRPFFESTCPKLYDKYNQIIKDEKYEVISYIESFI